MSKTIEPHKHSVETALKNKFFIDFYQRDYIWSKSTAITLLNDIFYIFDLSFSEYRDSEITPAVMEKYRWYYLNVFITNRTDDGKIYIVDGQQRLSTLTLVAIKLYHILQDNDKLKSVLKECIISTNGFDDNYNIDHDKRVVAMDYIFHNKQEISYTNKTQQTLVERYEDISKYIDDKFKNETNSKKLHAFILYFLKRLVIVELDISQDDSSMVFEVINDRGEALAPFEILKGKLIGALNKSDIEHFTTIWEDSMTLLGGIENDFFIDLIKSKYVFKQNSDIEKAINNEYHRYIFADNAIAKSLGFKREDENHIEHIKSFIQEALPYYAKLYVDIRQNKDEFLAYINANELSGQYQVILSACNINDSNEREKIQVIAREFDRLWVLLNLNGIYSSISFQGICYSLNERIKNAKISEYRHIFNNMLKEQFKSAELGRTAPLHYSAFVQRDYTNTNTRFLRYLFARVEKYICDNTSQEPKDSVLYITTKTGAKTGYHIEHILSHNDENKAYFDNEEEFYARRHLLGGLLLLKDEINISSGNEAYKDKLKTYSNALIWGQTLCKDTYHKTNKPFLSFIESLKHKTKATFEPYDVFDKQALLHRTALLHVLVTIIWDAQSFDNAK